MIPATSREARAPPNISPDTTKRIPAWPSTSKRDSVGILAAAYAPMAIRARPEPHATIASRRQTHVVIIRPLDHQPAVVMFTIFSENVIDATKTAVSKVKNAFERSLDSA